MNDLATLTDTELDGRIGAAVLDDDPTTLESLVAEDDRRRRARDFDALAAVERERRAVASAAAERDALLETLTSTYDALGTDYRDAIDALASDPMFSNCAAVHVLGIQIAALGNDLATLTGARAQFARRYDALDQIELHGGLAGRGYVLQMRTRPPQVPRPWTADLDRLRALMPRTERIGNGG